MTISDEVIRERAQERVAEIFGLATDDVRPEMIFATDFQARDALHEALRDMACRS